MAAKKTLEPNPIGSSDCGTQRDPPRRSDDRPASGPTGTEMTKKPSVTPSNWKDRLPQSPCDPRLPEAALAHRRGNSLLDEESLGTFNVTAWLYKDNHGREAVQVNPNDRAKDIRAKAEQSKRSGRPSRTADDEPWIGYHSEFNAAEWFRTRRDLRVLQIFTERAPCADCADFLRHWYGHIPCWYYYVDRKILDRSKEPVRAQVAAALRVVYGL